MPNVVAMRLTSVVVAGAVALCAGCAMTRTSSARSVTVSSQLASPQPVSSQPVPSGAVSSGPVPSGPASTGPASTGAGQLASPAPSAVGGSPDPALEKQLWAIAESAATGDGSPVKVAQAVRSTHALAVATTMGDGVEGDQQVWVIQVEAVGEFVCDGCSYPQGAVAPRGRYQVLVVDASTLRSLDGSIGDREADLAQLGPVVDLHP